MLKNKIIQIKINKRNLRKIREYKNDINLKIGEIIEIPIITTV